MGPRLREDDGLKTLPKQPLAPALKQAEVLKIWAQSSAFAGMTMALMSALSCQSDIHKKIG